MGAVRTHKTKNERKNAHRIPSFVFRQDGYELSGEIPLNDYYSSKNRQKKEKSPKNLDIIAKTLYNRREICPIGQKEEEKWLIFARAAANPCPSAVPAPVEERLNESTRTGTPA